MTLHEIETRAKENKQNEIEKIEASLKKDILGVLKDIKNILEDKGKAFTVENVTEELCRSFADSTDYADEFTDIVLLCKLKKLWKVKSADFKEFAY